MAVEDIERGTLDALRRGGTPASILTPIEGLLRERGQVRTQQFRAEKERVEMERLNDQAGKALRAELTRAEANAAAERDKDLGAIDQHILYAQRMPTKQPSDTEAEFSNKLAERHVLETRELAALTAAQVDVALALATDDVDTLEALVTEALDGNRPEHVRRVSRAVELRLAALARAEVATGSGAPRVAGTARQRVAERLRAWRAAEAEQSRPVKRQRIHQRYEMRVNDVRAAVERAARAFGLNIK